MPIKQSVGLAGANNPIDTKIVQAALNLAQSAAFRIQAPLVVDGKVGTKTLAAIETFQRSVAGLRQPDSRVDPNGRTLSSLQRHLNKGLSEHALLAVMALGHHATIQTYRHLMLPALPRYQVNTPLRTAHYLAQVGYESISLQHTQELASGIAYEGRQDLGNVEPGDGPRFKGRGLIQLTGRTNYTQYAQYAGVDLLKKGNETLLASQPRYALDSSLWFWQTRKLNNYADLDDLRAITRRVNGGYNGLEQRADYLERAKFFLLP